MGFRMCVCVCVCACVCVGGGGWFASFYFCMVAMNCTFRRSRDNFCRRLACVYRCPISQNVCAKYFVSLIFLGGAVPIIIHCILFWAAYLAVIIIPYNKLIEMYYIPWNISWNIPYLWPLCISRSVLTTTSASSWVRFYFVPLGAKIIHSSIKFD